MKINQEEFNRKAQHIIDTIVKPQVKKYEQAKEKEKKMGKITIEFDSVEESQDARVALDAMKWKMSMWDLDQKLRSTTKHGIKFYSNEEASSEEIDICEKIREEIRETLEGYGLNLND